MDPMLLLLITCLLLLFALLDGRKTTKQKSKPKTCPECGRRIKHAHRD